MESLSLCGIKKSFPKTDGKTIEIIKGIDFTLNENEIVSIIGESGCGKSTLLRIALGLIKPTEGIVRLNGKDIYCTGRKTLLESRRILQGVFQDSYGSLNPCLSTMRNLEEALLNLTSLNKKERLEEIEYLMIQLDINPKILKTPVIRLSGGEMRRLSLVRALSIHPKFLLMDEILSGLDLISTDLLINTLLKYKEKYKISYLFITHDVNRAYEISDRVIKIEDGLIKTVEKL